MSATESARRSRAEFVVIDDDARIGEALEGILETLGHHAVSCTGGVEGLSRVQELQPVLVFLDVYLPGEDGLELLRQIRETSPGTVVIMISAYGEAGVIVKAMKQGAGDFLTKPLNPDEVRTAVENVLEKIALRWEVERLRQQVLQGQLERRRSEYDSVFENSPRMKAIKEIIDQVADTDTTVLVWGESGVGKELVARAIHECSPRRERAFVKVNCAALPLDLLESELFGYERGAFTGAHRRKPGKFELADGGTIFLDEIGEVPLPLQAKLLQVLQDGQFSPLGSGRDIRVDVRVIAATNKDLARAVEDGAFREDLYYRLNVVNLHVPPLRERPEEIAILAEHFWQKYSRQYNRQGGRISTDLLERFLAYSWPGNVRELENMVKRIVLLESEDFVKRELAACQARHTAAGNGRPAAGPHAPEPPAPVPLAPPRDPGLGLKDLARQAARQAEREAIKEVLDQVHWNRAEAARRLKISYKALLYKIRGYDLDERPEKEISLKEKDPPQST
jgi:two-component system response regulator AtoC